MSSMAVHWISSSGSPAAIRRGFCLAEFVSSRSCRENRNSSLGATSTMRERARSPPTCFSIALGRKDRSFSALAQVELGQSATGVALKDINGDGKLDWIVTFELSAAVFVGQGNGSFYQPLHFGTVRNDGPMAFGALDADGKLDALVGNGGDRPSVSVLLNQTR
jgi:hypothetical protein